MSDGGVVLVHDYFSEDFPNVRTAVADFEARRGAPLKMAPIGDALSMALVR
ncbi:MAG: hypothetical protein LBG71_02495 [Clostridiales Family XIII bacterium]|jgi:hypothetical protein|nr:hypothetical protein [Clostridiales Family XIII bacterium]